MLLLVCPMLRIVRYVIRGPHDAIMDDVRTIGVFKARPDRDIDDFAVLPLLRTTQDTCDLKLYAGLVSCKSRQSIHIDAYLAVHKIDELAKRFQIFVLRHGQTARLSLA